MGQWELIDHHGADCVEEDLESAEEGLAKDRVEEKCFERGGKIGVQSIDAQGFVVSQVVWLWWTISQLYSSRREGYAYSKCSAVWQSDGEICKDSEKSIGGRGPKG